VLGGLREHRRNAPCQQQLLLFELVRLRARIVDDTMARPERSQHVSSSHAISPASATQRGLLRLARLAGPSARPNDSEAGAPPSRSFFGWAHPHRSHSYLSATADLHHPLCLFDTYDRVLLGCPIFSSWIC